MLRSIKKYGPIASLTLALSLAVTGCDGGDDPQADTAPVSIDLFTKTPSDEPETLAETRRLLVFDNSGACVSNYAFLPGTGSLTLPGGTYRMATLSVPEGSNLPADGVTNGLDASFALTFGTKIEPFLLSKLEDVALAATTTTSYTATLSPVTCGVTLRLSGLPDGQSARFTLLGMYASAKLDGTYGGSIDYPLAPNGLTVCFPTPATAMLSYSIDGGTVRTLSLQQPIQAGYNTLLELKWNDDLRELHIAQTTLTDWLPGGSDNVEAN